jgi:hypothetical protein
MLQFTDSLTIAELEHQLLRIENNPDSYMGGSKAFYSGYKTEYKPAVQRKVNKIQKILNALYDKCEA